MFSGLEDAPSPLAVLHLCNIAPCNNSSQGHSIKFYLFIFGYLNIEVFTKIFCSLEGGPVYRLLHVQTGPGLAGAGRPTGTPGNGTWLPVR